MTVANRYLSNSKTGVTGLRDLMWALLNTKEFIVNHYDLLAEGLIQLSLRCDELEA